MIYPENFLYLLDRQQNKIIHVKIISLTFDERPIETMEGLATAGSVNLDGASAVRSTCQLSLVTPKDYYWGLNTKIHLYIGVENYVDKDYPDIIWFDKGIYVITSFSSSHSATSYTINISGKDKMCLLNGEVGGSLNSSVDFGTFEQQDTNGNWKKIKQPVKNIIRDMVHQYAGEPFHNIIINDLEEVGLELQEYRYSTPMYIWRQNNNNDYMQGTLSDQTKELKWGSYNTIAQMKANNFKFEPLTDDFVSASKDEAEYGKEKVYVAEITYGQTAGYKEIDLVYPGELIANIGESITSVLDKIKNFLGDFEYFYNTYGQFVFQRKKTYVNAVWSPIQKEENGGQYVGNESQYAYMFSGTGFFTAINNAPNLLDLRNDFTVWGKRSGDVPIHMRYAIDVKPTQYNSIEVTKEELQAYNDR